MSHDPIKLDEIINGEANNDAIHMAVCPVTAMEIFRPGQFVAMTEDSTVDNIKVCSKGKKFGIISPYLKQSVNIGERCWVMLLPNTITSLRHEWTHPAFDAKPTKDQVQQTLAEKRLRDIAEKVDITLEELIRGAKGYIYGNTRLVGGAEMEGERVPPDFWENYEIYTGEIVEEQYRGNFFSCAC